MKSVSRYIRCFYFAFSTISRIYTDVEGTPEGSGTCAAGPNIISNGWHNSINSGSLADAQIDVDINDSIVSPGMQLFTNDKNSLRVKRNSGDFLGFLIRANSPSGGDASAALSPFEGSGVQGGTFWDASRGIVTCDSGVSAVTHEDINSKSDITVLLKMDIETSIDIEIFIMVNSFTYYYEKTNIDFVTRQPSALTSSPTFSDPSSLSVSPSQNQSLHPSFLPTSSGCRSTDPMYDHMISLDKNLMLFWTLTDSSSTFLNARLAYDGIGWIGFGFSNDGLMVGSDAVIGLVDPEPSVLKYELNTRRISGVELLPEARQTLVNTSIEQENDKTVVSFAKKLREEGEITINALSSTIFIWAYGSSNNLSTHIAQGSRAIDLSQCGSGGELSTTENNWKAHGIMMFVAWGVLMPLAITASLLRAKKWIRFHIVMNILAYITAIASIIVAIITTDDDKSQHFNGNHQIVGLVFVLLATLQVIGGLARPNVHEGTEKTRKRRYWEMIHKSSGYVMFIFSALVLLSGLNSYSDKYGNKSLVPEFIIYIFFFALIIICAKIFSVRNTTQTKRNIDVEEFNQD